MNNPTNLIKKSFKEHENVLNKVKKLSKKISLAADLAINSLKKGGTIYWCGNGGSSSDSMHLSAELIGKFKKKRRPLPSISLTGNNSTLTCIANDFGYKNIFSRQIEALGKKGDVLFAISTSGNSKNIFKALKKAKNKSLKTISFLGNGGGKCKNIADVDIIIKSNSTARIQEMHIFIGQIICDIIEKKFTK